MGGGLVDLLFQLGRERSNQKGGEKRERKKRVPLKSAQGVTLIDGVGQEEKVRRRNIRRGGRGGEIRICLSAGEGGEVKEGKKRDEPNHQLAGGGES